MTTPSSYSNLVYKSFYKLLRNSSYTCRKFWKPQRGACWVARSIEGPLTTGYVVSRAKRVQAHKSRTRGTVRVQGSSYI